MAATIKDFLSEKKQLVSKIDYLNRLCDNDSEETIKRELLFLKQKVVDVNRTITRFLNIVENLEKKTLSKMKDELQDLIIKLETSVCVPEFCINADIHNSCQNLTKKLIENYKEIMFCYNLTDVPRASTRKMRRRSVKANSYESVAPDSELIQESMKRKHTIKCKRKVMKALTSQIKTLEAESESEKVNVKSNTPKVKKIGRFEVVSQVAENTATVAGKKHSKKKKLNKKKRKSKSKKKKNN